MKKMVLVPTCLLILFSGCGDAEKQNAGEDSVSGKLVVFHAGSLSVPFREIVREFNKVYPNVEVFCESGGSRTCARKISDLNRRCDIMASADYRVIDNLLIPEHAEWNIKFATNEMAIVYHEASRKSKEISGDNWYEILLDSEVAFGRSEPNADPCGYRAVLTMQLAEKHYGKPGIAAKLLAKDTKYIRPKETDLLSLLESNEIDYIFLYRSVAQQHGLKYISLPDEINLKKAELADVYQAASTKITGKKPGEFITKKGAPMVYGITIPRNAPNPKAAIAFTKFVLSRDRGMAIMVKNGQPSAVPSPSETYDKIPDVLKEFACK